MALNRPNPSRYLGLALGPYDNFKVSSSNVIAVGDSAPSVNAISILYYTSAGTITLDTFRDGAEGQLLTLINLGSNVTFQTGGSIKHTYTAGTNTAMAKDDVVTFVKHISTWYMLSESTND